jgi:hypothetical protein
MAPFLVSCDGSSNHDRGLSTLVDRIKSFLGMGERQSEATSSPSEPTAIVPSNATPSDAPIEIPPSATTPSTAPSTAPSTNVAPPPSGQFLLSLDERMKIYSAFEETVLEEEEEKIKATENEASTSIDTIMKDPRVVALMQKNPNMTFEELPEDIYAQILRVSEGQEAMITATMEESDKKLSDKATALGVYDHINSDDLGSTREDKRRPSSDFKAKVDANSVILDAPEEAVMTGKEVVKDVVKKAMAMPNAPKTEGKTKAPQNPQKNSFNDDETS